MSKWSEINVISFSPCGINAVNFSIDKLNISWTFYYDKRSSDPWCQICICFFTKQFVIKTREIHLPLMSELHLLNISEKHEAQVSL